MLIYYSQSSMKTSTSLKVVRIPYDASAIHLTDITLTSFDPNAIKKDVFAEELGHIPDMQSHSNDNLNTFGCGLHSLSSISNKDVGSPKELWYADYMMYVCLDKRADLPQNKHLRVLHYLDDVTAYRDAFVFKMKPGSDGLDQSGHTEYLDMDDTFVLSAQNWGLCDGNTVRGPNVSKKSSVEEENRSLAAFSEE